MSSEALVIAGVLVIGGLVVVWHLTFSVDPRVHPHPFVLRPFEPHWESWDELDWEQRMRIFRRRQVVNWAFVILVVALLIFLFTLAVRGNQPGQAVRARVAVAQAGTDAGATLPTGGHRAGVAVTPGGRSAPVNAATAGEVAR